MSEIFVEDRENYIGNLKKDWKGPYRGFKKMSEVKALYKKSEKMSEICGELEAPWPFAFSSMGLWSEKYK